MMTTTHNNMQPQPTATAETSVAPIRTKPTFNLQLNFYRRRRARRILYASSDATEPL
jgi:hypothetical protein